MTESLKGNVLKLVSLYETEKSRADKLAVSLSQKEAELAVCKQQITELRSEVEKANLTGALFGSSANNSQSKERLDKLIHEIDKCISFLEQ